MLPLFLRHNVSYSFVCSTLSNPLSSPNHHVLSFLPFLSTLENVWVHFELLFKNAVLEAIYHYKMAPHTFTVLPDMLSQPTKTEFMFLISTQGLLLLVLVFTEIRPDCSRLIGDVPEGLFVTLPPSLKILCLLV